MVMNNLNNLNDEQFLNGVAGVSAEADWPTCLNETGPVHQGNM